MKKLTKKQKKIQAQKEVKKILRQKLSIVAINKISDDIELLENDSEQLNMSDKSLVNSSLRAVSNYLILSNKTKC